MAGAFPETTGTTNETPVIDKELLAILACPETHQPLAEAEADLVARLNARIESGEQKNAGGTVVTEKIDGGLVRQDKKVVYPVRDNIPVLLIEEGLPAEG